MVVCWCNHFPPFIQALFGKFVFSTVRSKFCYEIEVFPRLFEFLFGEVKFFAVRSDFRPVNQRFWWRSGRFVLRLQVSAKVFAD